MIKEHNGNVIKCHKCKTYLSFDNEDVTEVEREKFGNKYKDHFIWCPKCSTFIHLKKENDIWKEK